MSEKTKIQVQKIKHWASLLQPEDLVVFFEELCEVDTETLYDLLTAIEDFAETYMNAE